MIISSTLKCYDAWLWLQLKNAFENFLNSNNKNLEISIMSFMGLTMFNDNCSSEFDLKALKKFTSNVDTLKGTWKCLMKAGAPGAERGPGASSNMMDFRFCEVQNRRRKCCSLVRNIMWSPKKKGLHWNFNGFPVKFKWSPKKKKKKVFGLHTLILQFHFDGLPLKPMGPLLGSLKPTVPWWTP